MKKKVLSAILCIAMVATMLIGCTTESPTSSDDSSSDDSGSEGGGKKIGITIQNMENAYWAGVMSKLQEILDERGREFLDEHWRRNDLIRFGDFERDWGFKYDFNPDAANPQYRLWPLSIDVLNNNTNWTQNPGY